MKRFFQFLYYHRYCNATKSFVNNTVINYRYWHSIQRYLLFCTSFYLLLYLPKINPETFSRQITEVVPPRE